MHASGWNLPKTARGGEQPIHCSKDISVFYLLIALATIIFVAVVDDVCL